VGEVFAARARTDDEWGIMKLIATCALVLAVSVPGAAADMPTQPNIILISLDTLRADHLGCYGYDLNTSPNIDAFAAQSTRYAHAIGTSSWTLPSHASLFSGLYTFEHGVHGYRTKQDEIVEPTFPGDLPHLPAALQKLGYSTTAFVTNNVFLSPEYGFNRGFDRYICRRSYGKVLNLRVFEWLREHGEEPFFLFLNYFDTHRPYNVKPRPDLIKRRVYQDGFYLVRLVDKVLNPKRGVAPAELQILRDQYDTSIGNLDEAIGDLFRFLKDRALFDNSLIVLVSDHGEYLGEHDLIEHSKDIHQPVIGVPLLIKAPCQKKGAVEETATSIQNVPGLIARALPETLRGELAKTFKVRKPALSSIHYTRNRDYTDGAYGKRFHRVRRVYVEWPWKLIQSTDGDHALYNLANDPGEHYNRYRDQPNIVWMLTAKSKAVRSQGGRNLMKEGFFEKSAPQLTEEQRANMRALGYL
jgi:arylsulfatase A-like enzyme